MVKPPSAFSQQFRIPEKVQVKPTIASFILLALMAFHVVKFVIALSYMYRRRDFLATVHCTCTIANQICWVLFEKLLSSHFQTHSAIKIGHAHNFFAFIPRAPLMIKLMSHVKFPALIMLLQRSLSCTAVLSFSLFMCACK